jgi:hypothetical protein
MLMDRKERKAYCVAICEDEITQQAMTHLDLLKVNFKQRLELELIKRKCVNVLILK